MARGWESKSVEAQQSEALQEPLEPRRVLSPKEAEMQRTGESLRLARARTLQQLESASSPRYRALLMETLEEIDGKLKRLSIPI